MMHSKSNSPVSLLLLYGLSVLFAGCLPGFRPTPEPIPSLQLVEAEPASAGCVAVMLPGILNSAKTFERHDFGALAAEYAPGLDVLAVDAHFAYYRKKQVLTRLREDIIVPLQEEGSEVWFVGTSLGGVGSLLYARGQDSGRSIPGAEDVAGLILLAPFMGDDDLLDEIEAAGGPIAWRAQTEVDVGSLIQAKKGRRNVAGQAIWSWLVDWHHAPQPKPRIVLSWGDEDGFDRAGTLAAGLLPESDVYVRSGGHDWKTWRLLFEDVLQDGVFEHCAPNPGAQGALANIAAASAAVTTPE
ncbi:MAG: hypothetical protein AAF725_08860 [Acidobacteriota bacterium]